MDRAEAQKTMNINSGVFIDDGRLIVVIGRDALSLLRQDCGPRTLVAGYEDIRFLTASLSGEHLAFWSITGESFRLIDLTGQEIWSCWMNTDKATPHGIQFSTSGDAVACIYDFEGVPGMFFCDIEKRYTTIFGCSGSPIGYDTNLQYFVIDSCDPYEDEKLAFYEHDAGSGNLIKLHPEVVSEKMKKSPLIVDRNRCIYSYPVVPMRDWDGLFVQEGMEGFVILKDRSLLWLAKDSDKPQVTVNDCLPQEKAHEWYRCTLTVCGDMALIQSVSYGGAIVVNRNIGVVWRGNSLSSTTIRGQRVLAQYTDGTVEVIQSDGSIETRCLPPTGFRTVAVDILDNVLYIAYMSERSQRIETKTFGLTFGS